MPMKVGETGPLDRTTRADWNSCKGQPQALQASGTPPTGHGTGQRKEGNFQEALAAHFELMREIGEAIPEPRAPVDSVEVAAW